MNDAVIVALVTGGVSLIGSILTLVAQNRLTLYRISQLEEKMDRHNNIVERMAIAEQSVKSAHHRIDTMEGREHR